MGVQALHNHSDGKKTKSRMTEKPKYWFLFFFVTTIYCKIMQLSNKTLNSDTTENSKDLSIRKKTVSTSNNSLNISFYF